MANEFKIIDSKVGGDHRSLAENPMVHALSCQWPFGKSKLDLKQSLLRRVRSNNLKLASWRAELVTKSTKKSTNRSKLQSIKPLYITRINELGALQRYNERNGNS